MVNKEEIVRALSLWFQPGDVFEIRALKAITPSRQFEHTESGYFDFEHIREAADAIEQIRFSAGVYVTINPVKRDLLARAVNKLRYQKDMPATTDSNILRRNWLLIDCDPVREAGIASSDDEHNAAIAKAVEIRDALTANGWPSPILIDSGNGAHLTYHIDLPTDDGGLIQSVLNTLKEASSEQVDVDISVFNPARIVRVPGTMNCKGDDADGKACGRPHRMAKILDAPAKLSVVTELQLKELIGEKVVPISESNDYVETAGFDIDSWIAKFAPDVDKPVSYKGGRKWTFKVCPFNAEHTNRSAIIIESVDGAIGFRCLHNSCTGNDWRKLRVLREPGCYDHKDEFLANVNIDGIMNQASKSAVEIIIPSEPEIIRPWRSITTSDIEDCLKGTFLGELTNIYASVVRPPLPTEAALLKAIVTAACCLSGEASNEELEMRHGGNLGGIALIGHDRARMKINTSGGQLCNAYCMLVADSATGKDIGGLIGKFSYMRNPDIYHATQKQNADWNLGTAGSAAGIANVLESKPNALLNISELSPWVDKNHWKSQAAEFLTQVFSQGFFEENFSDRGRAASVRSAMYCAPNIIANIQPQTFNEKVDMLDVEMGFIGRFLISKMPEFYGNPKNYDSFALLKRLELAIQPFLRKHGIVDFEEGYSEELQKMFIGKCDKRFIPSWRRLCNEYYPRLMVMLSVTGDIQTQGEKVIFTDETKTKAKKLVLWFFANAERVLSGIEENIGNSSIVEKQMKRIFSIVQNTNDGNGVLTSEISCKASGSGTTAKQRQEILIELIARRWITKKEDGRYAVLCPPPDLEKIRKRKS